MYIHIYIVTHSNVSYILHIDNYKVYFKICIV